MNPIAAYRALHGFGLYTFSPNVYRIKRGLYHHENVLTPQWGGGWVVQRAAALNEYEPVEWKDITRELPSMREIELLINAT